MQAAMAEEAPLVTVTSPILSLADEKRQVSIPTPDGKIVIEPSGSRTQITVNGAEAERKDLAAGMTCAIAHDPAAKGNEPRAMDCMQ